MPPTSTSYKPKEDLPASFPLKGLIHDIGGTIAERVEQYMAANGLTTAESKRQLSINVMNGISSVFQEAVELDRREGPMAAWSPLGVKGAGVVVGVDGSVEGVLETPLQVGLTFEGTVICVPETPCRAGEDRVPRDFEGELAVVGEGTNGRGLGHENSLGLSGAVEDGEAEDLVMQGTGDEAVG